MQLDNNLTENQSSDKFIENVDRLSLAEKQSAIPTDRLELLHYLANQARALNRGRVAELKKSGELRDTLVADPLGLLKELSQGLSELEMEKLQDKCAEMWKNDLKDLAQNGMDFLKQAGTIPWADDQYGILQNLASQQVCGHVWVKAVEKQVNVMGFVYRVWSEDQETSHYLVGIVHGCTKAMFENPALLEAIDSSSTVWLEYGSSREEVLGPGKSQAKECALKHSMEYEIADRALNQGKKLKGLESLERQKSMAGLDWMPPEMWEMAMQKCRSIDLQAKPFISKKQLEYTFPIMAAYIMGREKQWTKEFNKLRSIMGPREFNKLYSDRNEEWMPQLVKIFRQTEAQGVFVGAGHLSFDEKSLLPLLKKEGFRIDRMWPVYQD